MQTSFDSMQLAALLAVFMVYLVMASQFESLLHPFVILFSVPYAAIGVLVTLWLFDVTISIVVMIGVILMLLVAGLLEGFARQLVIDDSARLAVGGFMLALWTLYFTVGGRRGKA